MSSSARVWTSWTTASWNENFQNIRVRPQPITFQYQWVRTINTSKFCREIRSSSLFSNPTSTVEEFVQQIDDVVLKVLDKQASLLTLTKWLGKVANRWLSPIAIDAKRKGRLLEKRWKNSILEADRAAYFMFCWHANVIIMDCNRTYFRERIWDIAATALQRWDTVKRLLHSMPTGELQSDGDSQTLCERFALFFSSQRNYYQRVNKSQTNRLDLRSTYLQPLIQRSSFCGYTTSWQWRSMPFSGIDASYVVTERQSADIHSQIVQRAIWTHYCMACKLVLRRRCCTVVVQASLRLTITQEIRSHPRRTQQLQTNFELKQYFESTGASLFSTDIPINLCVSEL